VRPFRRTFYGKADRIPLSDFTDGERVQLEPD
jgi:hypothetical protein